MTRIDLLHRRLGGTLSLPSLPAIVTEIQLVCRDPGAGMRDVARLIAKDPPLSARALRVVNSAYFGLKVPVMSIGHAVAVLGMDALQNLVVQVAAIDLFQHLHARTDFDVRGLWRHAILTGRIAQAMPPRLRPGVEADRLELAGLLHDIGQFVLLDLERDAYVDLCVRAREEDRPLRELERETLGYDHTQVGALLAKRWNLPELVGRCIALHHSLDDPLVWTEPGVSALIIADRLARAVEASPDRPPADLAFLPQGFASQLSFPAGEVQRLAELAALTYGRIVL